MLSLIEEYFFDFFSDVRLAFKGRIQPFLIMIHGQSCLNMITIESTMQGDHKELKIMFQKCLISSHFNQKFSLERERTPIYRDFIAKIACRSIR